MKHFLFDLGGVIAKKIDKNLLENELITPKVEYCDIYMEKYKDLEKGMYNYKKFIKDVNKYLIHPNMTYQEYKENYINIGKKYGGIYTDTIEVIKELKEKGNKIYLFSNLIPFNYDELKKQLDINLFDDVFLSYKLKAIKPDKEIYEAVLKKINDNPNNIYFFDDKIKNVEMGRKFNINAYVATGENIKSIIKKLM